MYSIFLNWGIIMENIPDTTVTVVKYPVTNNEQ